MRKTVKTLIATGIIAAAPAAFAATHNDNAADSEPAGQMDQMDNGMGMMHGGNMMPMMAQMSDMMDTCNEMMQGMMDDSSNSETDADSG